MDTFKVNQLSDGQLESFNVEYVNDRRWAIIKQCIDIDFPTGEFTFLDVGGGNGLFADRLLNSYPNSFGTILDNSRLLLAKNKSIDRKTLVYGSAANISAIFSHTPVDIIFFNWVLHHLVGDSYAQTLSNIVRCLKFTRLVLSPKGRISIIENMYDGYWIDALPSYLIFYLSSSRIIKPITKTLGANTAGIGVCFLSRRQWSAVIDEAALRVVNYRDDIASKIPRYQKVLLHLGYIRPGFLWCTKEEGVEDCGEL